MDTKIEIFTEIAKIIFRASQVCHMGAMHSFGTVVKFGQYSVGVIFFLSHLPNYEVSPLRKGNSDFLWQSFLY